MPEFNDYLNIQLLVGKRVHSLKIARSMEGIYRKAASMINDKLARYEQKYPGVSSEQYYNISLLDFAVQVLKLENEKSDTAYTETVQRLTQELTVLLDESTTEPQKP